ncbi:flagellar basal body rod protein FlgB [Acidaminobacter hydrogenoformans]|uniref:Flagellar basal body rod protein FlgB n=1 Tax=Acidaminobacter hydrogenoformans DSM 2784 TaxID=1120920 RepID=A0A1G5RWI9_9FIRM|nr:flagellar basal body rod protein FlgB [Acidaminobacter hydrogenoformans]SCZ77811.1 flagellar basal-body rod protein FlgB [Acidaminobacter hydrogenoformans DSM 2784]
MIQNDMTYHLLTKAIEGTQKRQEAIASNLANLNTKNYKANRVSFEGELKKAIESAGKAIDRSESIKKIQQIEPRTVKDQDSRMNNDGNNVDLDQEMSLMAANQILYQGLIQQLNQKYQTMSYVIHEGRR